MAIGFAPFARNIYFEGWCIERSTGVGRMAGSGGSAAFSRFTIRVVVVAGRFAGSCERADFQKDREIGAGSCVHMIYNLVVLCEREEAASKTVSEFEVEASGTIVGTFHSGRRRTRSRKRKTALWGAERRQKKGPAWVRGRER